jgi:hypothetical protein
MRLPLHLGHTSRLSNSGSRLTAGGFYPPWWRAGPALPSSECLRQRNPQTPPREYMTGGLKGSQSVGLESKSRRIVPLAAVAAIIATSLALVVTRLSIPRYYLNSDSGHYLADSDALFRPARSDPAVGLGAVAPVSHSVHRLYPHPFGQIRNYCSGLTAPPGSRMIAINGLSESRSGEETTPGPAGGSAARRGARRGGPARGYRRRSGTPGVKSGREAW